MSDSSLSVHARLSASDEASPVVRKLLANVRELERAATKFNASFGGIGRSGMASMTSLDRVTQTLTAQMRGFANTAKQASRDYAADWKRAADQRLAESRQMYSRLERMERDYQRQLGRSATAERRQSGRAAGRVSGSSIGRIPAPRFSTLAIGGAATGAGIASAIRKRMLADAAETRAAMFGELSKDEIKNLRRDTDRLGIRYGVGSTAAMDAATEGLKSGIQKQFAGQFAELGLKAKAGLDINEADTAKLMGRLTTMHGGFDGKWLSSILNGIAVANNSTAADGREIIEAYRRSLSVLTETKMKPEDLAAFDASAISIGIQPNKAGTYMSFISSELANAKNARGQRGKDLSQASNLLGFAGRADLSNQMIANPTETLLKIYERMMRMPEALRAKVANLIGQREWRDELLSIAASRDLIAKTITDIANKPGFLDSTALKKVRSMAGRWTTITAVASLAWEKVAAGFDKMFDEVADAFINNAEKFDFDSISQHVSAFIEGLRTGFGFKDWGEAVNALANQFSAGTIQKWKDFGEGLAEGLKQIASGVEVAFKAFAFLSGGGNGDAKTIGKLAGEITGLAVALAVLAPVMTTLAAFVGVIRGIAEIFGGRAAARMLGGGPVGTAAMMAWLFAQNNDTGLPDTSHKLPGETTSQWRERQRKHRQQLYHKSSYTGMTDLSGRRRDPVQDLSENLDKFTGKVERAAFISGGSGSGGIQNALFVGGGGNGLTSASYSGVGRKFISGVPSIMTNTPGTALPNLGGGIIRRDKIPNFNGAGGSMAGDLSRSAFEKKFAGTALAGKYDAIVAAANANGISPALLAGVIAHESGNGHVLSGNNPGGIMNPATGMAKKMQFSDLDAGISKTAQTVAKNYRKAGGDLDRLGSIYAPPGAANDPRHLNGGWVAGVRKQMQQMSEGGGAAAVTPGLADKLNLRGKANYMHGQYGGPGENLTTIKLDSGKKVTVNAAAAESFKRFFNKLEASGYKINSIGGYNLRKKVGGGGGWSQHAYGNAVDVNPDQNPQFGGTNLPPNVSDMAAESGLSWGGDWSKRWRDPMHFEWNGTQPWKDGVTDGVPSNIIQNVPAPRQVPGVAGGGGQASAGGPVNIHINGSSHDPEALATLVQRRIDESMNWRTHDTASEYT